MLVDGSTVACFVMANALVVKGVVLIRTLLVCPCGMCELVTCVVDRIPATVLGRNPLTVSDPLFISIAVSLFSPKMGRKWNIIPEMSLLLVQSLKSSTCDKMINTNISVGLQISFVCGNGEHILIHFSLARSAGRLKLKSTSVVLSILLKQHMTSVSKGLR